MDTTSVYVEQVIIGFFVIVTAIVLATGTVPAVPEKVNVVLAGLALIGASYVAGILYDRCADSLLDPLACWNRVAFAVRGLQPANAAAHEYVTTDPFPEYSSRLLALPPSQMYMLSRLRILRAFTTLIPAMTAAWCVYGAKDAPPILWPVVAVYAVFAAIAHVSGVPPTNDRTKLNAFLRPRVRVRESGMQLERRQLLVHPLVIALLFVAVCTIWIRPEQVFAGTALTLLTGWGWLRVSDTHLRLIRDLVRSGKG